MQRAKEFWIMFMYPELVTSVIDVKESNSAIVCSKAV